ncbi:unnamed protein product, partial [Closterium sp. Yama58-4]
PPERVSSWCSPTRTSSCPTRALTSQRPSASPKPPTAHSCCPRPVAAASHSPDPYRSAPTSTSLASTPTGYRPSSSCSSL